MTEALPAESPEITFAKYDKFKRESFSKNLTRIITKFHKFYDEAFVLSLNARYGSGKTTFLKMWSASLREAGHKVIYINSWETDFDNQPLIPIISSILENLQESEDTEQKMKAALRGALAATSIGVNSIISHATGINIKESLEELSKNINSDNIQHLANEIYNEHSFKKLAYKKLKDTLSEYTTTLEKSPLIILVDELDRVRPSYAVEFLEAIKHIFSVKGVCFVLAVDKEQLRISIQQLYGPIDFENYYKRFITNEAELPATSSIDISPYLEYLATDFFDAKRSENISFAFRKTDHHTIIARIEEICAAYRLTPRQVAHCFRSFCQFMAVEGDRLTTEQWIEASILLITTKNYDPAMYRSLGEGSATPESIVAFVKKAFLTFTDGEQDIDEILLTFLAFSFYKNQKLESDMEQILRTEISFYSDNKNSKSPAEYLASYAGHAYGRVPRNSVFEEVYKRIEIWESIVR